MNLLKSVLRGFFSRLGYTLQKKNPSVITADSQSSMAEGLKRMKTLGISPATIIDIGAAQGTWTEKALAYWPASNYILVEPLMEQQATLQELKRLHPNIDFHLAVAGETAGETWLNISDDLDGSGVYGFESPNTRKVPVLRIDDICKDLSGDFLIKLDTHGYEVPILKGASSALQRTSLLIIEVYGFYISPTCLLFNQLSSYLEDLGFRLIDIVDTMRRPGDKAFWQADAFFIRKDHPVFANNNYV
jgi:FkbM family methyltransferase